MKFRKWLLSVVMTLILALILIPVTVFAEQANTPSLRIDTDPTYGKPRLHSNQTNSDYERYQIFRSESKDGKFSQLCIKRLDTEQNYMVDFTAEDGITYYYKIRKVNDAGNVVSDFSNIASVTCKPTQIPIVTKVSLSKTEVSAPDVVYVTMEFEEGGMGAKSAAVSFFCGGNYIGGDTVEFDEYKFTGDKIKIPLIISSTVPSGTYYLSGSCVGDSINYTDYPYYSEWFGLETENITLTVTEEFNIKRNINLANSNLVKYVSKLNDGEAANIFITSGDQIVPKAAFEAIAGKDVTLIFYGDEYSWIFNGKDISTNNCKDINLNVTVSNESGADYGSDSKVAVVKFKDNGKLPGKAEFRIQNKTIYKLFSGKKDVRLYYRNGDKFVQENTQFAYKSDLDVAYYTCFDVTHNSTFVISRGAIDTSLNAPSIKVSNNATSGKPTVTWGAVNKATQYEVRRATSKTGTYSKLTTTSDTSYTDTSAKVGTTYYYKVRAIASSGIKSDYSKIVSRICKLAKPKVTTTNVSSTGKIKISWEKVSGATKYEVHRATSKNGTYSRLITVTGTSVTNTSTDAGKTYYYKVKAISSNSDANSAFSSIVSRTCDLAQPKVTADNTASTGKIKLSWAKVSGAKEYAVYRATSKTGDYKKLATTTSASYTDTSAKAGKVYYYKVKAICTSNSNANSALSSIVSKTCDLARPDVTAKLSSGNVKLSWGKVSGASEYKIYRATSKDGEYKAIKTTSSTSYTDKTVKSGKTYFYKVKAICSSNSNGNSAMSSVDSVKCK